MSHIFSYDDYKELIQGMIERQGVAKGYKARLADAAGCKPAYLSQVLKSHVHLTLDHGAGLAAFWGFSQDESEYFLCLLQVARSSSPILVKMLTGRLHQLKDRNGASQKQSPSEYQLSDQDLELYYSTWYFSAVHMVASIPRYSSEDQIAGVLGISPTLARVTLERLQQMSLVQLNSQGWVASKQNVHLPHHSPLCSLHHLGWRQKAHQQQTERPSRNDLHYTSIHALSAKDAEMIRQVFLDAIEKSRTIVGPSPEEVAIGVCFDFMALTPE